MWNLDCAEVDGFFLAWIQGLVSQSDEKTAGTGSAASLYSRDIITSCGMVISHVQAPTDKNNKLRVVSQANTFLYFSQGLLATSRCRSPDISTETHGRGDACGEIKCRKSQVLVWRPVCIDNLWAVFTSLDSLVALPITADLGVQNFLNVLLENLPWVILNFWYVPGTYRQQVPHYSYHDEAQVKFLSRVRHGQGQARLAGSNTWTQGSCPWYHTYQYLRHEWVFHALILGPWP